jgi:integrase
MEDVMSKLTKVMIDSAREKARIQGQEVVTWDTTMPGFGIRVKPSGTVGFMIQYRNEYNKSRRHTIGRFGVMTLEEARTEARTLLSASSRGRDPRADKLRKRDENSVADLAARYMQDHCEGRCKASTIEAHKWLLQKFILPKLGRFLLSELTVADIAGLHQSLKGTPYNANRALGLLRAMLGWAEEWGLLERGGNPATSVRRFRETKRQRFLSRDELARLATAIDDSESERLISPHVAGAIRLLIVTGARSGEIVGMRWSDIDWDRRLLVLREHKTDNTGIKALPLNAIALDILREIPRDPENPYVITGLRQNAPLVNLQKPWRRIRKRAGLDDVRIHDLRHSFASFGVTSGASLPVIGGLLGHRSMSATSTYAHLSQDPLRDASEKVGALVGDIMRPRSVV